MHFKFVKEIVTEIKKEVANGGLIESDKIINGAGRNYKDSPLYNAYVKRDKFEKISKTNMPKEKLEESKVSSNKLN